MASLKVHYQTPAAQAYSMNDVTNSLATFMQWAKEQEQAELTKKYNSIMVALRSALWMKLPPQTTLPSDAIKPSTTGTADIFKQNLLSTQNNQGLTRTGRNAWGPTRGRG